MSRERFNRRWMLPVAIIAAAATASFGLVGPARAAEGGTSLSVTKTMTAQLVETFGWTLSKSASPSTLTLDAGESADVEYTVGATKSAAATSATFTGEICVTNTGAVATQGLQIIDTVSKPPKKNVLASTTVDVGGHPVLAPGERHCYPYEIGLAGDVVAGATYKDTAKVTIANKSGRGGGASPSATTVLPTTAQTVNNDTLTVADTNGSTFEFAESGVRTYEQAYECPADAGAQVNTVSAQGFAATPGVAAPEPASATVTVVCPSADVAVVKTADAATVDAGGAAGFTMTVSNEGSGEASGVALNDPLPAGVDWAIDTQSSDACSITGASSSQLLSCAIGSLAPGATTSVHVTGVTDPADCGTLTNTATVSATNEPAAGENDSDSATVDVRCPDVAVVKTADADTVDAGGAIGFAMTVSNAGPGAAAGVSLNDPLPAGVDWSIDSQSGEACSITGAASAEVLSCAFGELAAGATTSVHVTGATDPGDCGTLTNTATVSATNEPAAGENDSDSADVSVLCPDVAVVKTADSVGVGAGLDVGFTMTVSNAGEGTASGVTLSDPLPAGVNWAIDSQSGEACSITGASPTQVLSCEFGELAVGATRSVHVTAATTLENCGPLSNTATVFAANEPAWAGANNSSTATTLVRC